MIEHFAQQLSETKDSDGWEGIPPLQTLHKLAVWLRSSALHMDIWRRDVGLNLGIDNATRWSSWFKVLSNALKKKSEIIGFLLQHDEKLEGIKLTGSDWELLAKTRQFLKPYALGTLLAQSDASSVSESLLVMDVLLSHYEKTKKENPNDQRLLKAISMGWYVLDKYYTLADNAPVYAATLLLDPARRLAYIKQNWPVEWHQAAIDGAREIWEEEYKGGPVPSPLPLTQPPKKKSKQHSKLFKLTDVRKKTGPSAIDDIDVFMTQDAIEHHGTALQWWTRPEQRLAYPKLSRMAMDLFSIPSSSAESERAFSGARRTVSWDRSKMTCESMEKVECVGNWLKEGHIVPSYQGGDGLRELDDLMDNDAPSAVYVDEEQEHEEEDEEDEEDGEDDLYD